MIESVWPKKHPKWLGISVAETLVDMVFRNAKRMPDLNPDYDFIWEGGYTVNVKAATQKVMFHHTTWKFIISENFRVDYFLCIAFDNRDDLNVIHAWFIPGNIVSKKCSLTISDRNINEFNKFELPNENFIKCCNQLKEL